MRKLIWHIRRRFHKDIYDRFNALDGSIGDLKEENRGLSAELNERIDAAADRIEDRIADRIENRIDAAINKQTEMLNAMFKEQTDEQNAMFKERNAEVDNKLRELAALQNEVLNALRLNWDLYGDNPIPFNVCQKPSYNPYAPGGYYSPMPSAGDIEGLDRSVQLKAEDIAAIDINETRQRELLDEFDAYYGKWPFLAHENKKHRYFYNNDWFNCGDGFFLYSMLRYVKPERIIEAGSGFSSALMLDVNDMFFEGKIELTFIEPNPGRLKGLLRESDRVTLIKRGLQEVDINIFADLKENDILFIDSSHVSKFGSDVNYLIHEILPILNEGVYIHIHDIDWPFDYPGGWLKEGRAYNEAYILRAFLEYNTAFSIEFFESYMMKNYYDEMLGRFPLLENGCGLSLWMRKREA